MSLDTFKVRHVEIVRHLAAGDLFVCDNDRDRAYALDLRRWGIVVQQDRCKPPRLFRLSKIGEMLVGGIGP